MPWAQVRSVIGHEGACTVFSRDWACRSGSSPAPKARCARQGAWRACAGCRKPGACPPDYLLYVHCTPCCTGVLREEVTGQTGWPRGSGRSAAVVGHDEKCGQVPSGVACDRQGLPLSTVLYSTSAADCPHTCRSSHRLPMLPSWTERLDLDYYCICRGARGGGGRGRARGAGAVVSEKMTTRADDLIGLSREGERVCDCL